MENEEEDAIKEEEENDSPFREGAVDRLSSPDQLDKLMVVVSPKGWLALICFAGLVIASIIWTFLGSIPIEVEGKGILLTERGLFSLSSTSGGVIAELPVSIGSWVKKDDILAKVYDSKALQEIKTQEVKLEELVAQGDAAKVKDQNELIADLRKNVPTLNIYAYETGKIIELDVSPGDYIDQGALLGWALYPLEDEQTLVCHSYFKISEGEQVFAGMQAKMGLESVDVQSFGYLEGEVAFVSSFPVSDKDLSKIIRNPQLVTYIKQGAPTVIAVHVKPKIDTSTASGYAWSSKKGPNEFVKSGTICNVKVVVENRKPISYLFPQWFPPAQQPTGLNPNVYPGSK